MKVDINVDFVLDKDIWTHKKGWIKWILKNKFRSTNYDSGTGVKGQPLIRRWRLVKGVNRGHMLLTTRRLNYVLLRTWLNVSFGRDLWQKMGHRVTVKENPLCAERLVSNKGRQTHVM